MQNQATIRQQLQFHYRPSTSRSVLFFRYLALVILCCAINTKLYAQEVTLDIPIIEEHSNQHLFFHTLLYRALLDAGHQPKLVVHKIPHLRANQLLETGDLSLLWLVESQARNQHFVPVEIGLTDGLIGQRVLLIRPEDQEWFSRIQTLEDLRQRNIHTALGKRWFDVKVWQQNQLPFVTVDGNWRTMFTLLKRARVDYLSRSVIEVIQESREHPTLSIENSLLLVYNRDYRFYLSHKDKHYKPLLEEVLLKAKESGLLKQLVQQYWANDFRLLKLEQRKILELETPK
ncbi:MAG: hypothetical protein CMI12_07300 [Oceanospirillum sp.]|nr:hypothetical protein [Oceanospirillum sp.]